MDLSIIGFGDLLGEGGYNYHSFELGEGFEKEESGNESDTSLMMMMGGGDAGDVGGGGGANWDWSSEVTWSSSFLDC